jgi:hypothetical protein
VAVQDLPYETLQDRLHRDGQVLVEGDPPTAGLR